MKIKKLLIMFAVTAAFLLTSCNSAINPLKRNETPQLFPISQNGNTGYINRKGEIVIQPQFKEGSNFFSEGLAAAKNRNENNPHASVITTSKSN